MNLLNVEKEKLTKLLEDIFTPDSAASQLESSCALLEAAAQILSQTCTPERTAKLGADERTQLLLSLRQTAESLKNTILQTIAALPSQSGATVAADLNQSVAALSAQIADDTEELEFTAEAIKTKIDEARKLREDITAGGKELESYYSEVRKLEETLILYAAADRRIVISLPRVLNGTKEKLNNVETLLQEIDEELKRVLEAHQQGADMMQKINV